MPTALFYLKKRARRAVPGDFDYHSRDFMGALTIIRGTFSDTLRGLRGTFDDTFGAHFRGLKGGKQWAEFLRKN